MVLIEHIRRCCLCLVMLVMTAAFGPAALAYGVSHQGHPHDRTVRMDWTAGSDHRPADETVVTTARPDGHAHRCHSGPTRGASCCCPVACAALLAPLEAATPLRFGCAASFADTVAAFDDLRHGPPLPPPRG